MEGGLIIAILGGLGGMIGWGLADLFAKKSIDNIGDIASLAWGHIFGTLFLFIVAMYTVLFGGHSLTIPNSFSIWLYLIFFGVLQAIVYLLVYRGFGKGQVAVLNPIFASFAGIAAILSIVFLHEIVSGYLIIGLVIIFSGVILISIDFKVLRDKKYNFSHVPGFKEIAAATILAAFWTLFWNLLVDGKDWIFFALYMYAFMTIAILIATYLQKISLRNVPQNIWKYLIFIGLGEVLAYLAISWAYSTSTHTSVIALISGAFSLPTIILARVFLKEKTTRLQLIASLVIITGIVLLSVL